MIVFKMRDMPLVVVKVALVKEILLMVIILMIQQKLLLLIILMSKVMLLIDNSTNQNPDSFNQWPSSGFFPLKIFEKTATTSWSIYLGNYSMTNSTKIALTSDNNQYVINVNSLFFTDYSKNIYYFLQTELKNNITSNSLFISGKTINVRIENLTKIGINYTVYDVKFFSAKESVIEKITLDKINISRRRRRRRGLNSFHNTQ